MKRSAIPLLALLCLLPLPLAAVAAEKKDAPGCKDHPLFPTRMPNYRIEACEVKDFSVFEFYVPKGPVTD